MEEHKILRLYVAGNERLIRDTLHLRLDDAAELCGMNPKTLSRIETGGENICTDTLYRLCRGYKRPPEDFYRPDFSRLRLRCLDEPFQPPENGDSWERPLLIVKGEVSLLAEVCCASRLDETIVVKMFLDEVQQRRGR